MTFSFTKEWISGETLDFDDLNGNFTNVADILNGGIKNQHISTAANIGADKIADRYTLVKSVYNLVPFSSRAHTTAGSEIVFDEMFATEAGAASSGTANEFWVPSTPTKIARHEIVAQPGMEGHLMAICVYVRSITKSAEDPTITVKLNDTLIGQGIALKADNTFYRLHANTPFSNPLLALSDKDVIDFYLGAAGAGEKVCGVWATIYERWSIGS